MKNKLTFTFFLALLGIIFSSCDDVPRTAQRTFQNSGSTSGGGGSGNIPDGANTAISSTSKEATVIEIDPTVEIRHLVEPKIDDDDDGGTYTRKLTLPKNYDGLLYLAGINVNTLKEKNVKVRFRFGLTRDPITVSATIGQAAGLTPQTAVEVLVMDMRYQPFRNVQLVYDLFDYNNYNAGAANALDSPVQDNKDKNLFCRGLNLTHDPTFNGGSVAEKCDGVTDICKYAYAKVVDQGMVKVPNSGPKLPISPSEPNIQAGDLGLYRDTDEIMLKRCTPDNPLGGQYVYKDETLYAGIVGPQKVTLTYNSAGTSTTTIDGEKYRFDGPYRAINYSNWQVESTAIFSAYGLFGSYLNGSTDATKAATGTQSLLFPLQGKMDLQEQVEYLGANDWDDYKVFTEMASNGPSQWMDGCNLRATSVDNITGEHIGSCNVTALVEIISVDEEGRETVEADSIDVKLQLVKPQQINNDGEDVILSSFQSCNSNNQCASDECCFNKRCWDDKLVSQCLEDVNTVGHLPPGSNCQSDFECASLCCNQSTGKCAVHDNLQDPPVYCSKPSGQFCIAREWCMKHTITECAIVKTGFDAVGNPTCALRCYTHQEFGDCVNGVCKPPPTPTQPIFNPNDPTTCATAIDPPSWDPDSGLLTN